MLEKLFDYFKNLDKKTSKIMNYGLKFCFAICLIAVLILFTYICDFASPFIYYLGINLFKLSLILELNLLFVVLLSMVLKNS